MTRREQLLQIIQRDVQQDCEDYRGLRDLMQDLYQQLHQRNCQAINQLNEQIMARLGQSQARAQRRSKILDAFGLGAGGDGMGALLAQLKAGPQSALAQNWQQLNELAQECKQLNERNGKLLALHHEILNQLLRPESDAQVYAPQAY